MLSYAYDWLAAAESPDSFSLSYEYDSLAEPKSVEYGSLGKAGCATGACAADLGTGLVTTKRHFVVATEPSVAVTGGAATGFDSTADHAEAFGGGIANHGEHRDAHDEQADGEHLRQLREFSTTCRWSSWPISMRRVSAE